MQETWVPSLSWEDTLEKETATHSSIIAWRIPWTEQPGRLQSTGSQRVGHAWAHIGNVCVHTHIDTCVCICVYKYIHRHVYVCMCVYTHMCTRVCVCVCVSVHADPHTNDSVFETSTLISFLGGSDSPKLSGTLNHSRWVPSISRHKHMCLHDGI